MDDLVADAFSKFGLHRPHGRRRAQHRRRGQKIQPGRSLAAVNLWIHRVMKTGRIRQAARRQQTKAASLLGKFDVLRRRHQLITHLR